ncbi:DEAD/DEAH box helicase [uncultured Sphingomonas sp.]|uniref:DEAD/DEAH box helicase n=1 Tax=uncultured Sphingomonas sp. TaxID=158754 RepID=UPI002639560B|nr:DEAD/DEAH box helicase [uncultured Sphingomonas sp.]
MLEVDYTANGARAVLRWDAEDQAAPWVSLLKRVASDHSEDMTLDTATSLSMPWWAFAGARAQFLQVFQAHQLRPGAGLAISETAADLLRRSRRVADDYQRATTAEPLAEDELRSRLDERGFDRALSAMQVRNVTRMASLPAAATFSVPGAGKTTEALAWFFQRSGPKDRLLVVAPKNAFAAWDEQISECVPFIKGGFTRLRGGRDQIQWLLVGDPRFMLITYQQLTRVSDLVANHLAAHPAFVFLDESHRIKSGVGAASARATLSLSHLPIGKLIMSGTPMPQAVSDLIPQFNFLYPEIPAREEDVIDLIRPVFVRTNKKELDLPAVDRHLIRLPMAPVQHELYQLMKHEVAREAATALSMQSKQAFRSLGRSVSRLLQYVSNPSLLAAQIGFAHPDLLAAVLAEGDGPKLDYVLRRTRQLCAQGHKVLIWSSFVRNVEYIAARLADLGAVYIHGGVDAGADDDAESREGKIKLFHDNPTVKVMVANPAAASEGVSLHRICHHAIYLDRTFNAAHYLQSEDRIHRFGLPKDQSTDIEIVECTGTVDETVRLRLGFKITQMGQALEDSSLAPDPIPIDPIEADNAEDREDFTTGLALDDIRALVAELGGGG